MSRRSGVIYAYVLLLVEVISSLLFTPYLIRSLGQAEYGLYSLAMSMTAYFLLLDAGVGNALVRFVAKFRVNGDSQSQRQFLGLSLVFYGAVAVVIGILGGALRANLPAVFGVGLTPSELDLLSSILVVTLAGAAATLVASVFDRTIIAYERFVLSKLLSIVKLVLRAVVVSVLLFMGYGALAAVVVNLALTVAFGLFSAWYVLQRLNLRPSLRGTERGFLGEVMSYSGLVFLQMIAAQVNATTDQVLLGIMTSSVTVGVYAVGAQLSNYFQSIAGSVNGVLMPGVVRMVEKGSSAMALLNEMVKVGRLVFMVLSMIVVGFAVAGRDFVSLWAGSSNGGAFWVALILMSANLLYLTQAIGTQILWAMGRHKVQAWLNVAVAMTNILLTAILIRWHPLLGASIGTAVAVVVGNVLVMNVVFAKYIGVSMREYYRRLFHGIVPCLAIAALVGFGVAQLPLSGWAKTAAELTAMVSVYSAVMGSFGMNVYERQLASTLLRRFKVGG